MGVSLRLQGLFPPSTRLCLVFLRHWDPRSPLLGRRPQPSNLPLPASFGFFFLIFIHSAALGFSSSTGSYVAAHRTQLCHVGSSSPTRSRTWAHPHWEGGVLATGPPGKSHFCCFLPPVSLSLCAFNSGSLDCSVCYSLLLYPSLHQNEQPDDDSEHPKVPTRMSSGPSKGFGNICGETKEGRVEEHGVLSC